MDFSQILGFFANFLKIEISKIKNTFNTFYSKTGFRTIHDFFIRDSLASSPLGKWILSSELEPGTTPCESQSEYFCIFTQKVRCSESTKMLIFSQTRVLGFHNCVYVMYVSDTAIFVPAA